MRGNRAMHFYSSLSQAANFNHIYIFFFFLLQKRREDRLAPRPRHLELGRRANVATKKKTTASKLIRKQQRRGLTSIRRQSVSI